MTVFSYHASHEQFPPSHLLKLVELAEHVSSDLRQHLSWLEGYRDMGFRGISLHNVNRQQEEFIRAFGREVLPRLAATS